MGTNNCLIDIKNKINKIQKEEHFQIRQDQIFIDLSGFRSIEQNLNQYFIEKLQLVVNTLIDKKFQILVYIQNESKELFFSQFDKENLIFIYDDVETEYLVRHLCQSEIAILSNEKMVVYALLFELPFMYLGDYTMLLKKLNLNEVIFEVDYSFDVDLFVEKLERIKLEKEYIINKIRAVFEGKTLYIDINQDNIEDKMEFCWEKIKRDVKKLIEQGFIKKAKNLLNEYEKIVLNDIEIYSIKSVIAMLEGNFREAERIIKEGLLIDEKDIDLLYNLGYLYWLRRDYGLALFVLEKVKSLAKDKDKEFSDEIDVLIKEVVKKYNKKQKNIEQLRALEFKNRLDRINFAHEQKLQKREFLKQDLHVVYLLTHVGICGGVKIIFEHANHLKEKGVEVTLISHFPRPTWYPINCNYIQVPFEIELAEGIPDCDVIVATYWDHIQVSIDMKKAPVVYFEQGDFHIFEYNSLYPSIKDFVYRQLQLPQFIFTVSNQCARLIKEIYNRKAIVIPNAIEKKIFKPNEDGFTITKEPYILMVGNPGLAFKGINDIIKAFEVIKKSMPNIKLYLISPQKPDAEVELNVEKVFVNPSQQEIAHLYRNALMYICGSYYESFCLPALEAMACGCPVVTTNNEGVLEYAQDNYNALIVKKGEPMDIADKALKLIKNKELRERLRKNGLLTAEKFDWSHITSQLIKLYKEVASYKVI